jgi:hypothetical protein
MFHIQILNQSTLISDQQLAPIVAALQVQVDRDFTPIYNIGASLTLTSEDNGMTPIYVVDTAADAPPNALAWHTVDDNHRPFGIIPMKTVLDDGADAGPTISHELLELLADPRVDVAKVAVWPPTSQDPANIAYEDCDPVENDSYPITTSSGTANVSNFVTPPWFVPHSQGPWDFLKKLNAPLMLTSGGYLQWQRAGSSWHQVDAAHVRKFRAAPHYFSRAYRRVRNLQELQFPGHHAMVRRAELAIRQAGSPKGAMETLVHTLMATSAPETESAIGQMLPKVLGAKYKPTQ